MKDFWSPVVFLLENDMETLDKELRSKDEKFLRKCISYHHMDGTSKYLRYSKDQLIELIKDISDKRARKGDCFRNL